MIKDKATLVRALALPMMFALVASCGGGSGGGSAGPVTVPQTPPPAPPPPPPPPTPPPPLAAVASKLTQADARIGACVNMANHLEPPNEGDWGRAIADDDFVQIAAKGFQTVRVPVRFSGHALTAAPYTIDATFMARVEQVVTLARASNLRVIIDLHNYDELFTDPAGNTARFVGLWKQIAERFKTADDKVWFELINEPHDKLTNANLLSVIEPALVEIRKTNPTRPVVYGGESYSGINSLASLPTPGDAYVIATFHYYDPFGFTHQGAPFVTPVLPTGVTFGSQADKVQVARDAQKATDFTTRTGRPVFLGEYGAYEGISLPERATYYRIVADGFRPAQVDGCVWGYTNSFQFRKADGSWYQDLLTAIGL